VWSCLATPGGAGEKRISRADGRLRPRTIRGGLLPITVRGGMVGRTARGVGNGDGHTGTRGGGSRDAPMQRGKAPTSKLEVNAKGAESAKVSPWKEGTSV